MMLAAARYRWLWRKDDVMQRMISPAAGGA